MKGGTLFSGIGAPELAAPEIDWRWCAEIELFASTVLATHYPSVPNLGDVAKVDWDAVEPVDIIVFGSPCQSFSIAGKRTGLDDPRGNMAIIGLRVVDRLRPRWMVFENVPGLLSSDEWRDFGTFLGLLGQCGYGFAYRVLDAQYTGVPQRRRRVFVVGYIGDWRPPATVLLEPESLSGHPAPSRETGEAIAATITKRFTGGSNQWAPWNEADNLISNSVTTDARHGNVDQDRGTLIVRAVKAGNQGHRHDPSTDNYIAYALCNPGSGGRTHSRQLLDSSMRVRRLTPRECERLQGFPDNFTAIQYNGKPAADGPRYRALGNAMAVPVMRWILQRIRQLEEVIQ